MTALKTHAQERVFLAAHTDLNLLPEKFRKELRSAVPYLISNVDQATQEVEIDFEAEHWEGEPGSESWVSRTFVMRKMPSGENVVEMEELTAEAKAAGGFIGRSTARNQAGSKVGVGNTVQLKHQIEFQEL